jgi:hypothetical protein
MKTQDLRTNEVVKEVIDGVEIFTYKGIEIDRDTWESASCPMFCGKITDDDMRQLVVCLYDEMVSVYGEKDVKTYIEIKDKLANCESCDYKDIQYYDEMDSFRWIEEERLFCYSGGVYYEDMEEDDEEDDENYIRAYATNIQWDTECGDEFDDDIVEYLPSRVEIPFFISDDKVADMLSDNYGYCVLGFEIEEII